MACPGPSTSTSSSAEIRLRPAAGAGNGVHMVRQTGGPEDIHSLLGEDDLQRLEKACGNARISPGSSLYSPGGPVQRVNREAVLLAGGGRALLMQIAHPLVAAGVARHSGFESDPLGRLWRTLDLTLTITFGDAASALNAVKRIEHLHGFVRGELGERVGRHAAGSTYDASAPELLFWVHATLVDSAMCTYDRFVRPLNESEREDYYLEAKIAARLFGIPDEMIPRTLRDFDAYMDETIGGGDLAVGADGRRVAESIMDPPLPVVLRQLLGSGRILTEGLLPPALRDRFGYQWNARRQRNLERAQLVSRRILPHLPDRLRYFPHAIAAGAASR